MVAPGSGTDPLGRRPRRAVPARVSATALLAGAVLAVTALAVTADRPAPAPRSSAPAPRPLAAPATTAPPAEPAAHPSAPPSSAAPVPAAPAPPGLPVIDYGPAPRGFPPDPAPHATDRLTEGLRPTTRIAAYDAPGGRPRAFLASTVGGAPLVTPIVARRAGWVAVLLPSANRTIAWLPPGPWRTVPLRDHLVVERRTHTLTWHRDGRPVRSWRVTLGMPQTPTPLGRTFILGRSALAGEVYAGTDVFALGAVPDDPDAVPAGLRGAHIGLHTWYHDGELGRNTTDGCIRLTRSGQRLLLSELDPGTALVVVDRAPAPPG